MVSVTDLQTNLTKANAEQNKLAKQVNELRSEIEHLRDREEKLSATIDNMKQRHEQDMSSLRRHAAGIQREKSDQSKQIEALTSELAIAKAQSRIGKHASMEGDAGLRRAEKEQTDSDQAKSTLAVKSDSSPSTSPPSSPKQSPARNQAMEVETLKTSLAHAHRIISNLRSNLHKEKTEKFEFKKLLAESQETIEQLQNDPRMWVDAGPARNAGGSSSNAAARVEDGQFGGRRPHKASTSSTSKRRGKKALDPRRSNSNKLNKSRTAGDNDSVYSYTSMSDNEDSEIDSFDESDADTANIGFGKMNKKAAGSATAIGFTPLSSELSQSQVQKPISVDAQMNTDTIDELPSLATVIDSETSTAPRSLGDELGMAMSRSPSSIPEEQQQSTMSDSVKNVAGGLVAGAATALGMGAILNNNDKKQGVEISTQTETEAIISGTEISTQTEEPIKAVTSEIFTQTDTPTEIVTIEIFTQTDPEPVPNVSDTFIQTDEEPKKATSEMLVQTDDEPIVPVTEISTQTDSNELHQVTIESMSVEPKQQVTLQDVTQVSVDVEPENPSIAAAALATAIAESRKVALENAVDQQVQSEPEDPSIAEAALATATAAAILASRKEAFESAVHQETQSEIEDPSIAEAASASAIAASRKLAFESAISQETQCDPEDSSINEATIAAAAAAAILASRKNAIESAVHQETQSEAEDPSIAEAAIAATTAAAIAASRLASIESAVEQSTQCEPEDPSIAIAATAAAIAASRKEAIESAISQETQFEAIPVVDHEIQCDPIVGTDCGVQSEINTVDVSIQSDLVETKDSDAQYEATETVDASVQHEESEEHLKLGNVNNRCFGYRY